jgi:hypothetical protein
MAMGIVDVMACLRRNEDEPAHARDLRVRRQPDRGELVDVIGHGVDHRVAPQIGRADLADVLHDRADRCAPRPERAAVVQVGVECGAQSSFQLPAFPVLPPRVPASATASCASRRLHFPDGF